MAGHAVSQCEHIAPRNPDLRCPEKGNLGNLAPNYFAKNLLCVRSIKAKAIFYPAFFWVGGRIQVTLNHNVVVAGHRIEFHPVLKLHAADEFKAVLFQIVENAFADHLAVVIASDKLLGSTGYEIFESVDTEII